MMRVSVIMPVYNAAGYIEQAVESALAQPEVVEIILVEDASPDDSLAVCEALAAAHARVRVYRHPDRGNHGAGASRNVGLRHSTAPYVAFLDADDYFLPGRFVVARQLFEQDATIDGVYEAIDAHFESPEDRQRWMGAYGRVSSLTTMTQPLAPDRLFEALVTECCGHFSGNGLVVKREIFERTGEFGTHRHEDTAMWIKMAAVGRLVSGRLDTPVAMRRVHPDNRLVERLAQPAQYDLRLIMWRVVWLWSRQHLLFKHQGMIFAQYLKEVLRPYRKTPVGVRQLGSMLRLTVLLVQYPGLALTPYFWTQYLTRLQQNTGVTKVLGIISGWWTRMHQSVDNPPG
jgi:glycosyltransferase involved in cell wall biosynthesis